MGKKRQIIRTVTASTLSFSLLLASCTASEDSMNTTGAQEKSFELKSAVINRYSPEQIFRGLYFLEGNFVTEMASLREMAAQIPAMTPGQRRELQSFNDEIVRLIAADDPLFFDNLKNAMSSTDLYRVREAYVRGAEKIREVGLRSLDYAKVFGLSDLLISRRVDLNRSDIQNLDLSKEEDVLKFAKILQQDYGIVLEDQLVSFATCNLGVWCAVTMVAVAQSVVGVWVYAVVTKVKFWDPTSNLVIANDVFILELSRTMR